MNKSMLSSGSESQEIIIKPSHRVLRCAIVITLLIMWLTARTSPAIEAAIHASKSANLSLSPPLLLWFGIGVVLIAIFGWLLFGAVVIRIFSTALVTEYRVWKFVLRTRKFDISRIHNMRLEERSRSYRGKTTIKCAIVFEDAGKKEELLVLSKRRAESLLNGPLLKFYKPT